MDLKVEVENFKNVVVVVIIIIIIIIIIINFKVVHLGLFRFRILTSEIYESIRTFGRTPGMGDRPDARPLPTQDNTTQKNADTLPCLEWDSNPRSQCSSGRRQYVPQTARPLRPAKLSYFLEKADGY
jgi:hypothetical protein